MFGYGAHRGNLSEQGIDLLKLLEGKEIDEKTGKHILYNDSNDNASIGYGRKLHDGVVNKDDMKAWKGGIGESKALEFLKIDVGEFEDIVNNRLTNEAPKIWVNQAQFDALTIFAFNAPRGNLAVMRALNNDTKGNALRNLWLSSSTGGDTGLINRRTAEYNLYMTGNYIKHY